MSPVAAVDCGTNSIRLLIADADADAGLAEIDRRMEIVRLGQGVDATGEFHPDALTRTFTAVDGYADLIEQAGVPVENLHFVATSASRDAGNRDEFFAGIEERLGVRPDIISGDTEARLSFTGAISAVAVIEAQPVLVMDIGGGSTELIIGTADGRIHSAISLDVGSVRLTERFLRQNPTPPEVLREAQRFVDRLIEDSGLDLGSVGTWVGVAGTVTTLTAAYLELDHYDRTRVHGARVPVDRLPQLVSWLAAMSVDEIKAIPSMHPGRADVITGGALVVDRVGARVRVSDMIVSESDILDGIALELIERVVRR